MWPVLCCRWPGGDQEQAGHEHGAGPGGGHRLPDVPDPPVHATCHPGGQVSNSNPLLLSSNNSFLFPGPEMNMCAKYNREKCDPPHSIYEAPASPLAMPHPSSNTSLSPCHRQALMGGGDLQV